MLSFLEWLYDLSFGWKIVLLIAVLFFTVGTPYIKEIWLFFKFLFTGKKLNVEKSGYRFVNDYEIGTDTRGVSVFVHCEDPNTIIDGGTAILYWYGEGIIWSKLKPYKKRMYGNTAEVKVTKSRHIFEVTVYGVFSKKKILFEIPLACIRKLELKEFVSEKTGFRDFPEIQSTAFTKEHIDRFEITTFETADSIISKSIESDLRFGVNEFSNRNNPVQNYSFSTQKYNEVLKKEKTNKQTT